MLAQLRLPPEQKPPRSHHRTLVQQGRRRTHCEWETARLLDDFHHGKRGCQSRGSHREGRKSEHPPALRAASDLWPQPRRSPTSTRFTAKCSHSNKNYGSGAPALPAKCRPLEELDATDAGNGRAPERSGRRQSRHAIATSTSSPHPRRVQPFDNKMAAFPMHALLRLQMKRFICAGNSADHFSMPLLQAQTAAVAIPDPHRAMLTTSTASAAITPAPKIGGLALDAANLQALPKTRKLEKVPCAASCAAI